jgi:hypothetical protein
MTVDFAEATAQIEHRGAKGRERETLVVKTFLDQYLPDTVRSVHGAEILDSLGARSSECDIVITDPSTPPLYITDTFQLIPVEWAHGVIEVKSNLDGSELRDAQEKIARAKALRKLTYLPQTGDLRTASNTYGQQYEYFPMYGLVFAYTAIRLETLCSALWELQRGLPMEQWVDGVVVLDQGVLGYSDTSGGGALAVSPLPDSSLQAITSENPLVPAMLMIQTAFTAAWMRPARLGPYLGTEPWGNIVGSAGP